MSKYEKPATTYNEQIAILKERNLVIMDESYAADKLKSIGYFRLSGYWLSFYQKKDYFKDGTTFEHIINVHEFDSKMRNLLMGLFEEIEIMYTTRIAHEFAMHYSPLDHYNEECFDKKKWFNSWLADFESSVKRAGMRKELYVKHYDEKYEGIFPVWTALEMSSFGSLSKFYNNLTIDVKKLISKSTIGVGDIYLKSWLYAISVTRNMCAHNSRLYDKTLNIAPRLPRGTGVNPNSIFAIVFVCKRMLLDDVRWQRFVQELKIVIETRKNGVNLSKAGFPEEWERLLT